MKKTALFLLVASASVALAACQNKAEEAAPAPEATSEAPAATDSTPADAAAAPADAATDAAAAPAPAAPADAGKAT